MTEDTIAAFEAELVPQSVRLITESDPVYRIADCAGVCYQRPQINDRTEALSYITKIVKKGHTSILEHWRCAFVLRESLAALLLDVVHWNENLQYFTCKKVKDGVYIEGNLRAWYTFFTHMKSAARGRTLLSVLITVMLDEIMANGAFLGPFDDLRLHYRVSAMLANPRTIQSIRRGVVYQPATDYYTFEIRTSRAIAAQICRHRSLSPIQESTRYVRYSEANFEIIDKRPFLPTGTDAAVVEAQYEVWRNTVNMLARRYLQLIDMGMTPQMARGVLPQDMATSLYVTGTAADWYRFAMLRIGSNSSPEISEIARMIHRIINPNTPVEGTFHGTVTKMG